ncbi:hypothetical protein [Xenorhabdus innexi]|uniref:Uncharacterized protein n=1 Tax=Xenorhabdus innexi TaxID=290109 RepID=A0A1N6N232_9GAMM|nr:hypothetical protein [Xenorhabdus innexi]PHM37138.1 hypothetical protein Xinn_01105 [Xenorhabdus innexi]SIP75082.1 hypothetical protein XIS1_900117 [Xenorhabdus innexi]
MNNNAIEFEKEINKLQFKAANEVAASWITEKQLLTISIIRHFLEKGDNEAALSWTDGILDYLEEDFSSEIENNEHDLDSWLDKRLENEVSTSEALEIICSEMPTVEAFKKSWVDMREKLAEYGNMQPVAWARDKGMGSSMDVTTLPERVAEWREFNESHPEIADDIFPLYRHLSKESLEFTAEIELTACIELEDDKTVAFGKIFNDSKKRFNDGVEIKTSPVINPYTYITDGYIKTQNSVYKIRHST